MKLIDKLTMDIFNQCMQHFEKEENKTKLQNNIIEPIIIYISEAISQRIYGYFIFLNALFILTFMFVLIILILILGQRKS